MFIIVMLLATLLLELRVLPRILSRLVFAKCTHAFLLLCLLNVLLFATMLKKYGVCACCVACIKDSWF